MGRLTDSLDKNLPAKSSQFSLVRPTRLDKIKNLHVEVQVGALDISPLANMPHPLTQAGGGSKLPLFRGPWMLAKLYTHRWPLVLMLVAAWMTPFGTACGAPTLSSMVNDVSPGVVQVVTPFETGSGFIIDADGLVVTNAHVVRGFDTVDVRLSGGQSYQGVVLGVDEITDLALLDLRAFRDFEPVALGNSDAVTVGEDVIAMGFPSGNPNVLFDSPTITRGIVSAKRVSTSGVKLLQTDAAINPGNSGGPLFDRHGRVVGINTFKLFESEDGRPVEGIGLVVAINEVRDRLDLLAKVSFVSVSAGTYYTCGVMTDGSLECWGFSPAKSAPAARSFVSVSAGHDHLCVVKTDGSVECGGSDDHGESTPPAGSFVSVSAGSDHTCGVKTNGSVECWGLDHHGEATPPAGSFVSVSAGSGHTCGVMTDGSLECWGFSPAKSAPPAGSFVSVSAGMGHTCGVKTNGSVECWGFDHHGEATPPAGSFVSVSTGWDHTCGVKTDGSIACWGDNSFGQSTDGGLLGVLTRTIKGEYGSRTQWVIAGSFASVSAGHMHSCGVTTDDSIVCWGRVNGRPPTVRVHAVDLTLLAVVTALSFCAVALLITDVELFGTRRSLMWGIVAIIVLLPVIWVPVWTSNIFFPVTVALTGIMLAVMLLGWVPFDMKPHLTIRRGLGIILASASIVAALTAVFVFSDPAIGSGRGIFYEWVALAGASAFAIVVVPLSRLGLRRALTAIVGLALMTAFFEFAFLLLIHNVFLYGGAELAAFALVALTASFFARYLRGREYSSHERHGV